MEESVYVKKGYSDRAEYLKSLCEEYDEEMVYILADLLGEEEDFDGLVTGLEDGEML